MALTSGTKLGPYARPGLRWGPASMGEVYRARDTRLDRTVAVKILPSHLSENAEARQRFDQEARTISSVNHPHICTLYDVGHQDGVDYLVMEFLDGETLAERLRKGPLPMEQVLRYAVDICDGLEKAHRCGVIHRDLKPGNIMLTKVQSQADGLRPGQVRDGELRLRFQSHGHCQHTASESSPYRTGNGCRHVSVHGAGAGRR